MSPFQQALYNIKSWISKNKTQTLELNVKASLGKLFFSTTGRTPARLFILKELI